MIPTDLSGKTAVVTGGGGVLCSAMAKALARCGARVAVLDQRVEAANRVAKEIGDEGGQAMGYACNVLEKENLKDTNERVEADFGPVDILINGAGGNHPKGTTTKEYLSTEDLKHPSSELLTFYDLELEGLQFVFNLNVLGTLLPTQAFTRSMAERKSGVVINISSMNAFTPLTKIPAYSSAKAAVSNFTRWLAVHMSKVGIRVNAIAPGFFDTDHNHDLLFRDDRNLTPRGETIIAHTPMGRFGNAEDLVGVLLWLANDEASAFVTGAVIPVDGGFSSFSGV